MATAYECANLVMDEVKKVVTGKDDRIQKAFAAILAAWGFNVNWFGGRGFRNDWLYRTSCPTYD